MLDWFYTFQPLTFVERLLPVDSSELLFDQLDVVDLLLFLSATIHVDVSLNTSTTSIKIPARRVYGFD